MLKQRTYEKICAGCEKGFSTGKHTIKYCNECRERRYRISDEGIFERDEWKCRVCGATAEKQKLQAHHIRSGIEEKPEDKITLCLQCHIAIHIICTMENGMKNEIKDADLLLFLIKNCNTRYYKNRD